MNRPKVGIGIIIQNVKNEILIGKRKGSHAPYFSIPGGHLELGETFEAAATREMLEETGIQINTPQVISVANNLRTFREEQQHYISVNLFTNDFIGKAEVKEPDKCEFWPWYPLSEIPQPHFDASEFAIECFLQHKFYIKDQL